MRLVQLVFKVRQGRKDQPERTVAKAHKVNRARRATTANRDQLGQQDPRDNRVRQGLMVQPAKRAPRAWKGQQVQLASTEQLVLRGQ